eukprot:1195394-Prorocentrum_minimum.AAC.5
MMNYLSQILLLGILLNALLHQSFLLAFAAPVSPQDTPQTTKKNSNQEEPFDANAHLDSNAPEEPDPIAVETNSRSQTETIKAEIRLDELGKPEVYFDVRTVAKPYFSSR